MRRILALLAMSCALCGSLYGCGTAGMFNKPLETGKSRIAATGVEYEVAFTREVINAHTALTSVLSTFKTSASAKDRKIEATPADIEVCTNALEKLRHAKDVVESMIPANGWESKSERFTKLTSQIIEGINNGLNDNDWDIETLSKQEVALSGLITSDSGATSLQGVDLWHD